MTRTGFDQTATPARESDPLRSSGLDRRTTNEQAPLRPACPACGGPLLEIRMKLVCRTCRTVCETCCEGGRG
jgi:hypothetical protein